MFQIKLIISNINLIVYINQNRFFVRTIIFKDCDIIFQTVQFTSSQDWGL